jgi:hypothetical protein
MFSDAVGIPFGLPEGEVHEFEEDEELEEEEDEELSDAAEQGDVCADCGDTFTESNGSLALCQECFDAAEDAPVKDHPPLSKFPVRG